jgi:hypothetical protein
MDCGLSGAPVREPLISISLSLLLSIILKVLIGDPASVLTISLLVDAGPTIKLRNSHFH